MKKILVLVLLLASATSFAGTRQLLCQVKPNMSNGAFGIALDNSNFDSSSNYFRIVNASWAFSYSSATMICSKNTIGLSEKEALSCIGYNSAGGLTEVSVNVENGVGTAKVHNFGDGVADNIYSDQTEGMTLPCRVTGR